MNIILPFIIGLGAAIFLLTAGYLFGIKKGNNAREKLRKQNQYLTEKHLRLKERIAQHENEDENLRTAIQKVLTPLVQRDQLSYDMLRLESNPSQQRNLTMLLDQVANKGNFSDVLLCDDQGWPLAMSTKTTNPDRTSVFSSLLLLLTDRLSNDESPTPTSLLVRDVAGTTVLCRLFSINDQRLLLTIISAEKQINSEALDPVLDMLTQALSVDKQESPVSQKLIREKETT